MRMGRIGGRILCAMMAFATLAPTLARAADQRNIVFILVDDMRWDSMSAAGHPYIKTPAIDKLAAGGVWFQNAFVTSSLCSPSRASFLTGTYAHRHGVINNSTLLDPTLPTFPVLLSKAGYQTAFFGKWHMGATTDKPQPGFSRWVSFRGQGDYWKNEFNIDGKEQHVDGYVTDVLTDMATDWIKANRDKPFMLYLSHKAVHGVFSPAERHKNLYADADITLPPSSANTPENYSRKPRWMREQRNSWHGVDDAWFKRMTVVEMMREYARTLQAVDDSTARVMDTLKEAGVYDKTLIIFASDNGFMFGEHGLIDKRCMYEESIRVPIIVSCPGLIESGRKLDEMVLNIDVAPTIVEAAGLPVPKEMQGRSLLSLAEGKADATTWRKSFLYEYFWEPAYPETPSMLGVRTDTQKFIEYQGVWDSNELYDLQKDPHEMHNHISTSHRKVVTVDPDYRQAYHDLRAELRRLTKETGALDLPSWRR